MMLMIKIMMMMNNNADDDDDDDGEQRCLCGICGTLANAHISSGIRTSQGGNCTANASHDQLMIIIIMQIAKNMWVCFLKKNIIWKF